MNNLPEARTADILEQEAGSELLIYDLRINKAYHLNETSKIVYRACNGETSVEDLKRQSEFADDLIYLALNELAANDLLEDYQGRHFAGLNRREVIRRVGLASMIALPLITGIAAPSAAIAASNARQANNTVCTDSNQCSSGNCISTTGGSQRCCVSGNSRANTNFRVSTGIRTTCSDCIADIASICCSGTISRTSCTATSCTGGCE